MKTNCIDCEIEIDEEIGITPRCPTCFNKAKQKYLIYLTSVWNGGEKIWNDSKQTFPSPDVDHFSADWNNISVGNQQNLLPFIEEKLWFIALLGPPGVGKTYITWGAIFALMIKNFGKSYKTEFIHYTDLLQLISNLNDFDNKADATHDYNHLFSVHALVIDDFGCSKPNQQQLPFIQGLIHHRERHHALTLITSNLNTTELAENIGEAVVDRFRRGIIMINGKSRRAL